MRYTHSIGLVSFEFSPALAIGGISTDAWNTARMLIAPFLCSAVVRPPRWENFLSGCREAVVPALLVISSAAGGMAEMIEDDKSGYFVPPPSPRTIRMVLQMLLKRPVCAVMSHGHIVQQGSHGNLMTHEAGRYRSLSLAHIGDRAQDVELGRSL